MTEINRHTNTPYTIREIGMLSALVGKYIDPDKVSSDEAKAVIYKTRALAGPKQG